MIFLPFSVMFLLFTVTFSRTSLSFHPKKRVCVQRHFWHCGIPEFLEFFYLDSSIVMRFVAV